MSDTTPGGSAATRKTHPLVIVAAGAVTLFCLVGIGVMTGIIPGAQSGPPAKSETVAAPPSAAGVAQAPIGSAPEAALPQGAPQNAPGASGTALPPIKSETLGQPNAKLDAKAANAAPAPAKLNTTTRLPNEGAGSSPTTPPTPVYASAASQAGTAGAVNPPAGQTEPVPVVYRPSPQICRDCGTVEQITQIQQQGQASGTGAVLGGLIGGVVGHQVGSGRGKDVATVAGAVGGALLGNQIEKSSAGKTGFDVRVRMEDNTFRTAKFEGEPGFRIGDRVRFEGGRLVRR